jgi:hypothetical protein
MGDCVYFKRKKAKLSKDFKTLARLKEVVLLPASRNTQTL